MAFGHMELSRETTLHLLHSIAAFLKSHQALWNSHVVEYFQDRLWEDVTEEWWNDLKTASVADLLWLPCGKVHDNWCSSLKDFVRTARSLALFRQPGSALEKIFPGLCKPHISNVLRQGMNAKKLHEVETLSAVVDRLSKAVHATHLVDVGAGQGYLAQVLAFEYGLPIVALDACAHHAEVTNKRSRRIQKHYLASARKFKQDCTNISGPQTATFRVMAGHSQSELQHFLCDLVPHKVPTTEVQSLHLPAYPHGRTDVFGQCGSPEPSGRGVHSYVLVGLHACGDLSATMIRTYLSCNKVKALVTVGCCYNLLSEKTDEVEASEDSFGFPLSEGVKKIGLTLGRRARDLACQSAERWKDVGMESATYNFEQHALRAGFQLVLRRYHPAVADSNPTIGRLGKARRRKQTKRHGTMYEPSCVKAEANEAALPENLTLSPERDYTEETSLTQKHHDDPDAMRKRRDFVQFCHSAFRRLGLESVAEDELESAWRTIEPLTALVGPYWSLRAVLGPVLETYILLDRLLYLQEQSHSGAACVNMSPQEILEPKLVALFDPKLSPRNMAIIASKSFI